MTDPSKDDTVEVPRLNAPTEMERIILREIGRKTMPPLDVVAGDYRDLWLTALQAARPPQSWLRRLLGRWVW